MRERINDVVKALVCGVLGVSLLLAALLFPGSAGAQDDMLITATGIGGVQVGATVAQIEHELDSFDVSENMRLTVDLRGHTVSSNGRVLFRAAQVLPDSPEIELYIVSSDKFRTAEGVGPGTSIADAAEIYGKPTLMLDPNNSGREFVVFQNQPEGLISFRTYGISGAYIGTYAGDAITTTNFNDDAMIASVWIGCTSVSACDPSTLPTPDKAEADKKAEAEKAEAEKKAAEEKAEAEKKAAEEEAAADEAGAEKEAAEEKAAAEQAEAEKKAAEEKAAAEKAEAEKPEAAESASDTQADTTEAPSELAKTGLFQLRQLAVVSGLLLIGSSLVMIERRFTLGPQWLR